jgi:dihydroorotate dehydrogenase electron transfer subunit
MIEQDCTVVSNDVVAAHTYLMILDCPDIASEARPGQFIMLRVTSAADPLLRRPFSIAGATAAGHLLILYRVVGRGTRMMSDLRPGKRAPVLGPLGNGFKLPRGNEISLLVAGGMGIAPLCFLASRMDSGLHLLAGYGSADQMIPLEYVGIPHIHPLLATEDGTVGHHGLVTDLLEINAINRTKPGEKRGTMMYACGPLPMLKAVADLAVKEGTPCQVSLESVMACGLGACQGCAVGSAPENGRKYVHVCQDGPVFNAKTLDWDGI